jgi:hypothetical protein
MEAGGTSMDDDQGAIDDEWSEGVDCLSVRIRRRSSMLWMEVWMEEGLDASIEEEAAPRGPKPGCSCTFIVESTSAGALALLPDWTWTEAKGLSDW